MKIINCNSSTIVIDLGDNYKNIIINASGERLENAFCVFTGTIKQIEPVTKELSYLEQQKIAEAISKWNSHLKTIVFE